MGIWHRWVAYRPEGRRWRTGGLRWDWRDTGGGSRFQGKWQPTHLTLPSSSNPTRYKARQGKEWSSSLSRFATASLSWHPAPAYLLQQVICKPKKVPNVWNLGYIYSVNSLSRIVSCSKSRLWWIWVRREVWVLQQVLESLLSSVAAPLLPSTFKSPTQHLQISCLAPSDLLSTSFRSLV